MAPAHDQRNLITTEIAINGKGPFRFVVDTGADRTVIADDVAKALALPSRQSVMVEGVVRTIPAPSVQVDSLGLGVLTRDDLSVPLLSRALLGCDGYLGLDAIDGLRVTLDFARHALVLEEPLSAYLGSIHGPSEALVSLVGEHGHLRTLDCLVDGIFATAFLDTGAEVTVANRPLLDALVARDASYLSPDLATLTGVTGGQVVAHVTTTKDVRLKELTFTNGTMAVADLQIFDLWGLAKEPAIVIGMNWIRQFNSVSIDYGLKELRFKFASLEAASRQDGKA